jgi:hypothetical protein
MRLNDQIIAELAEARMQESERSSSLDEQALVEAQFNLAGRDFDPEDVTKALGIQATDIWRQRLKHMLERTDFPTINWRYTLAKHPSDSLDESLQRLLLPFSGKEDVVVRLARTNSLSISTHCRVWGDRSTILMGVTAPTISLLARLNSEFWIKTD